MEDDKQGKEDINIQGESTKPESENEILEDDQKQEIPGPSQELEEDVKAKERKKPRVPSALTVENVKKHEEETDAIDVVELMTKKAPKDEPHPTADEVPSKEPEKMAEKDEEFINGKPLPPVATSATEAEEPLDYPSEDHAAAPMDVKNAKKQEEADKLLSDVWNQPKKQTIEPLPSSPAVREEVRGTRFTGEEYIAVSIDVQTDESVFAEMFEWPQDNIAQDFSPFPSRPSRATAAADGMQAMSIDGKSRQRRLMTSDLSSVEVADGESALHITQSETSGILESKHSFAAESDTDDENPVTEVTFSEYGGSDDPIFGTPYTLPSVGPPFILQYKAESQMVPIDYGDIDMTIPEDLSWEDMTSEQREYYQKIMDEMKRIRQEKMEALHPEADLINIEPHSAYGSRRDRKLAKERERERSRLREMEKQVKQQAGGQMMANQTNFYAFARQLKTVNYSLSSEKCMEEGWTIRPETPPTPEEESEEMFVHDPNSDIISGKRYEHMFVKKLYPNGQLFLTVFPDGTGNVWYPSGNVAVSIIASEKIGKLIFILHEDIPPNEEPSIQAMFEPTGYCTCYYPSGVVRLLLTPIGGEYFSPMGERLKKWIWKDTQTHVHAPPFQPITFALSRRTGVRIMSQESIYITFTDGRRSVRFNAGTRLRLKAAILLPKIERVDIDQVLLEEKKVHIQAILERINNTFRFPNSPRLKKLQLPNYLTAQIERTARLKARLLEQELLKPKEPKKKNKKSAPRYKSSTMSTATSTVKPVQEIQRKPRGRHLYTKKKEINDELQPVVIVN